MHHVMTNFINISQSNIMDQESVKDPSQLHGLSTLFEGESIGVIGPFEQHLGGKSAHDTITELRHANTSIHQNDKGVGHRTIKSSQRERKSNSYNEKSGKGYNQDTGIKTDQPYLTYKRYFNPKTKRFFTQNQQEIFIEKQGKFKKSMINVFS